MNGAGTPFRNGISVVIPTYNRADLLPETLNSILAQTVPAREIIVVDDGSTDGTMELLSRYAPRVRSLKIDNSGDLVARNIGMDAAAGDIVAFCDSDDLWDPDFLATMVRMWTLEPCLRVVYTNFVILREGVRQQSTKFQDAPEGFWSGLRSLAPGISVFDQPVVDRIIGFQPFFPSCMAADRQFLLSVGGWDTSVGRRVGCDFATAIRMAEHAPLGIVHDCLAAIRKHASNHSADVQAMNLGDAWILEHVLENRPSLHPHAQAIHASVARRRMQAIDTAFARQDFAGVRDIARILPSPRPLRTRLKVAVAGLPFPLSRLGGQALLSVGSALSSARRTSS